MRNRNTAGFLYVFFAAVLFSIGGLCIKMVPWNGMAIRDLDISRQTFIIMIKRGERTILPKGNLVLREEDMVFLYSVGAAATHEHMEF